MKAKVIIYTVLLFLGLNQLSAQCLVADYPFNGNANDESNNGYDAIVHGATTTTDRFGNPNSAYDFDGTDYIDTETSFDYQSRTVSFWFKADDVISTAYIVAQDAASLTYGSFGTRVTFGSLDANAGGDGGTLLSPSVQTGLWYHVALVRNATQTKYYLNGNLVTTGPPSSNGSAIYPNPHLIIGASRKENTEFFDGKIDDIKIFDCELNSIEIDSLYNLVNPGNSGICLYADYPFNGNADDESNNGYNAIVHGATTTTDRFGNPNSAYDFDGTDYIDTETSFDYQSRTVSFWFNVDDVISTAYIIAQDAASLNYGSFDARLSSGSLYVNAGGDGGTLLSPSVQAGLWYHVALVRNATQTKYYLNGNLVTTGFPSSNGSASYPNPHLIIGASRKENTEFFDGKIDDIRIFGCELDSTEIDSLYHANPLTVDYADAENASQLWIYPNPAKDYINITFPIVESGVYNIVLFDVTGQKVRSISNEPLENKTAKISTTGLSPGIYLMHINAMGTTTSQKVVVR